MSDTHANGPNLVLAFGRERVRQIEKIPNTVVLYLPPYWTDERRSKLCSEFYDSVTKRYDGIWDYAINRREGGPGAVDCILQSGFLAGI